MGLETGTYLDELVTTNPVGATDPKSQGDDHLRLIKSVLKSTFPGLAGSAFRLQTKGSNYTLAITDNMSTLLCTAALTLTLPDAGVLGNKHMAVVICKGASVTFTPTGADTVNGAATFGLSFNQSAIVFCDGNAAYHVVMLGGIGGSFATGDIKTAMRATAEPGWINAFGSIGDATSGGTTRANADCEALFKLLWADFANAQAPVSGGRGASAAADWAAHKNITIPDMRNCVVAGKGSGNYATLGASIGADTSAAVTSISGSTAGSLSVSTTSFSMDGPTTNTTSSPGVGQDHAGPSHIHANVHSSGNTSGSLTVSGSGTSSAFNIVQSTRVLNVFVKL